MYRSLAVFALLLAAPLSHAASVEAGKALVARVCAACHGAEGVSVADTIPNLGGQRARYLEDQLKALKSGARKNSMMNTIAGQLSNDDIANIAAYFASQKGAGSATTSDFMPNIAKTRVTFPDTFKTTFVKYGTANFPETKQVRVYYANSTALQAAKGDRPLPNGSVLLSEVYAAKLDVINWPVVGADGLFVPGELLFYSVMARDAGWGSDFPEILRNEDWNYAAFTPARQHRSGINHAECLACHKSQEKASFGFTMKELIGVAKGR